MRGEVDINGLSPVALAFLGDSVYETLVRQTIVMTANMPGNKLHKASVAYARAAYQAKAYDFLKDKLTEKEADIMRRGRNSCKSTPPRSSNAVEYRKATGFETLFGYLYLKRENERIAEIFNMVIEGI